MSSVTVYTAALFIRISTFLCSILKSSQNYFTYLRLDKSTDMCLKFLWFSSKPLILFLSLEATTTLFASSKDFTDSTPMPSDPPVIRIILSFILSSSYVLNRLLPPEISSLSTTRPARNNLNLFFYNILNSEFFLNYVFKP